MAPYEGRLTSLPWIREKNPKLPLGFIFIVFLHPPLRKPGRAGRVTELEINRTGIHPIPKAEAGGRKGPLQPVEDAQIAWYLQPTSELTCHPAAPASQSCINFFKGFRK